MAIKHFKATEHSPDSPSAFKLEEHVSMTTIDKIIQSQSANGECRLLPTVFTVEKGHPVPAKALGPASVYITEGELLVEDADDPEKPVHLTTGDVITLDEGTVYKFSTPSKARGFGVTYLQAPLVIEDFKLKDKA